MKLSDYEGAEAIKIAALLIPAIAKLTTNAEVLKLRQTGKATVTKVFQAMVLNEPEAAMEMYAIINGKDVEEFKKTVDAADMLSYMFDTFSDDSLMVLFGLRERKTVSLNSTPATASTKATGAKKKH